MMDFPKDIKDKYGIKDKPKYAQNNPKNQTQGHSSEKPRSNFPEITFRKQGNLRRELLTSDAENWAGFLYDNENGVTATQLRNFFNEVKALQSRIEAGGFPANEALVGLLKSKAAYAYARAGRKEKTGFSYLQNMIEQGSDLSKSKEDFNDFALFFEAVMGFFKGRR